MVARQKEKADALGNGLREMEERWRQGQALLERAIRDVTGAGSGGADGQV